MNDAVCPETTKAKFALGLAIWACLPLAVTPSICAVIYSPAIDNRT